MELQKDIFISYAREDLAKARQLAEALEACGWSVFWDRTIPAGKTWHEVIGNALENAHCVIVAWSAASITSKWVRDEADVGVDREILVPVLLDDVRPPLGYRQIQAANLVGWNGDKDAEVFRQLRQDIAGILGDIDRPNRKERSSTQPHTAGKPESAQPPKVLSQSASLLPPIVTPSRKEATPPDKSDISKSSFLHWKALGSILFLTLFIASVWIVTTLNIDHQTVQKQEPKPAPSKPEGPTQQSSSAPKKTTESNQPILPDMVTIPAGYFAMGSENGDADEKPVHNVSVQAFKMGRHEVTFDEYDRFARATGRTLPDDKGWGRGNRPVINVSWDDAKAYADWLSRQTGKHFRLPTEAEWEYAARAGAQTRYWWGDEIGKNRANCDGCGSEWDGRQTAPVGSFAANPRGLQDTAGNVLEWVADCYHDGYQGAPNNAVKPWEDKKGCDSGQRVIRGGSWYGEPVYLRSASRDWSSPDYLSLDLGFRLAQDL